MTFSSEFFFFKSAWIFACAFPWQKKSKQKENTKGKIQDLNRNSKKSYPLCTHAFITCTTTTRTNKGAKNLKNGFLLFHLVVLIVHASIFSPRFSQKQSAKHNSGMGTAWGVTWKHWPPVHGPPTDRSTDPFYGPPPTHPCYGPPQKIAEKENKQI